MGMAVAVTRKRDGQRNSDDDFRAICDPEADEAQLAAWLMAAFLNGLEQEEAARLTLAMAASGERIDLGLLPAPRIDKHSTGGVGDKTTLAVLPILAACGHAVVKMSGRGLGITGGTIDKLESVPGFRTGLEPDEMVAQAARVGVALTAQTQRLAPADKRLYELRDRTGTVASVPLITASILSKKIAGGADTVVLDVKAGSGAFMPGVEEAAALRESLESVGTLAGLEIRSFVTDMSQPLGRAVGNALEVREAVATLRGEGPGRFEELCCELAGAVVEGGAEDARRAVRDGRALTKAQAWFEAQGADWTALEDPAWAAAPCVHEVAAPAGGWARRVDARAVGEAALALGAGRAGHSSTIDHRVGVEVLLEVGAKVEPGMPAFRIHARDEDDARAAAESCLAGLGISDRLVEPVPVVLRRPA